MTRKPLRTRRAALAAGAALPFAAAGLARAGGHAAPMQGAQVTRVNRFMLGEMEVTTLLVGTRTVDESQTIFGMNVAPERFADVSQQAFIPADRA